MRKEIIKAKEIEEIMEEIKEKCKWKNVELNSEDQKIKIIFTDSDYDSTIPEYIEIYGNKIEKKEEITEENNQEIYKKKISVKIKNLNIGYEIYRFLINLDYNYKNSEIQRKLIRKSLVSLLPENNLIGKKNISEWEDVKFLNSEYFPQPDVYKTLDLVFHSRMFLEFKKAIELAKKSYNQKIFGYQIYSDQAIIQIEKNIVFKFENKRLNFLISNFLETFEKFDDFCFRTNNNTIKICKKNNEIFIFKRTFAKSDFKYLKELAIKTGSKIFYKILEDNQEFIIEKDILKIKSDKNSITESNKFLIENEKIFSIVDFI